MERNDAEQTATLYTNSSGHNWGVYIGPLPSVTLLVLFIDSRQLSTVADCQVVECCAIPYCSQNTLGQHVRATSISWYIFPAICYSIGFFNIVVVTVSPTPRLVIAERRWAEFRQFHVEADTPPWPRASDGKLDLIISTVHFSFSYKPSDLRFLNPHLKIPLVSASQCLSCAGKLKAAAKVQ